MEEKPEVIWDMIHSDKKVNFKVIANRDDQPIQYERRGNKVSEVVDSTYIYIVLTKGLFQYPIARTQPISGANKQDRTREFDKAYLMCQGIATTLNHIYETNQDISSEVLYTQVRNLYCPNILEEFEVYENVKQFL